MFMTCTLFWILATITVLLVSLMIKYEYDGDLFGIFGTLLGITILIGWIGMGIGYNVKKERSVIGGYAFAIKNGILFQADNGKVIGYSNNVHDYETFFKGSTNIIDIVKIYGTSMWGIHETWYEIPKAEHIIKLSATDND